jgi:hypothetical protein
MVKPIRDALNRFVYDDDRQIRYSETIHLSIDAAVRIRKASKVLLDAFCQGDEFLYVRIEDAPTSFNSRGETMDFENELQQLGRQYREEGYSVMLHPEGDQVPEFAKDFGADIIATRGEERVIVQAKYDRAALEADPKVPLRAEITNAQPGWRYDLVILNEGDPFRRMTRDAREPSNEEIEELLAYTERMLAAGDLRSSCVFAWSGLEAAMRQVCREVELYLPRRTPG